MKQTQFHGIFHQKLFYFFHVHIKFSNVNRSNFLNKILLQNILVVFSKQKVYLLFKKNALKQKPTFIFF